MGLGVHGGGLGTAEFFAQQGSKVLVTDIKKQNELSFSVSALKKYKNVSFVLGQHRPEDFTRTDLVIKSPAIPQSSQYLAIAKKNKIPIDSDIGIFLEYCPCPIIGITGTKGKSTTASLIYKILHQENDKVFLAGNVRISALSCLSQLGKKSLCVLELSSWQLQDAAHHKKSPQMAVILNIFPDHLNRHSDFQDYIDAKKLIFKFQRKKDHLILNYDDPVVKSFIEEALSQVSYFGAGLNRKKTLNQDQRGAFIREGECFYGSEKTAILKISEIPLLGDHNQLNVLAAISVAKLMGVKNSTIRKTVLRFRGLEGRIELIKQAGDIDFYNDTTATMPDASVAAIKTLKDKGKKIILIAGGEDKGLDYGELAEVILGEVKSLVLFQGSASDKLMCEIKERRNSRNEQQETMALIKDKVSSMKEAVLLALEASGPGDAILLSPGAASFNLFVNEFDRGNQFNQAVKEALS